MDSRTGMIANFMKNLYKFNVDGFRIPYSEN